MRICCSLETIKGAIPTLPILAELLVDGTLDQNSIFFVANSEKKTVATTDPPTRDAGIFVWGINIEAHDQNQLLARCSFFIVQERQFSQALYTELSSC